jgi:hypothetical protein
MPETAEPYDLPFPDQWLHRPEYVIVVDQLRGLTCRPPWPSSSKPDPPAPANQNQTWKPNHDPHHR